MTCAIVREVLLLWQRGASIRAIAREAQLDRKTVRRYLRVAEAMRFERWMPIDDDVARAIVAVVRRGPSRVSEAQHQLEAQRERIRSFLAGRMKLATIHAVLFREGLRVSYATLRRFAIAELGFRSRPTRAALAA
jgi:hypothetical protein